ncbi:MAG: GGDEF domain-containing response regulator [Arenimonas sp.]
MSAEPSTKTRVLFVDDSRLMQKAATKMLGGEFDVVLAADGFEALELLADDKTIQVVFSDLTMPRCDGYELLSNIRTNVELGLQNIPIIIVTGADNDEAARKKALDMGATDFITKPFTSIDVLARARAHANYQRITKQLQAQTTLDALTGLSNKAGFLDRLQQDISYARRHQHELTLVRLEIDELRKVFLEQGKQIAEALVLHVAQLLRCHIRKEDTAGRTGLGSFMMSMPAGRVAGIEGMVERLQAEVIEMPPEVNGQAFPITLSAAVFGPDVQLGLGAQEVFMECEAKFQEICKTGREPKTIEKIPAAVAVISEAEPTQTEPALVEKASAIPAAVELPASAQEPVKMDLVLDQIKLGDTQTAIKMMPQIIKRLVPLLRLLSEGQRAQLIQFLQKNSGQVFLTMIC